MLATRNAGLKSLQIGDITIDTPLLLAPMAGHSNYALRHLCRELGGCGLVCTELISSNIVKNARARALQRFDWRASERPVAAQLFGVDPAIVAEAARVVVDHGADIVDINMGCWVPKIAKKGGGAALLRDVKKATAVVAAVVEAVTVPVTVKVRSGFEDGVVTAVPLPGQRKMWARKRWRYRRASPDKVMAAKLTGMSSQLSRMPRQRCRSSATATSARAPTPPACWKKPAATA